MPILFNQLLFDQFLTYLVIKMGRVKCDLDPTNAKTMRKEELDELVASLIQEYQVFGPVQRRSDVSFQRIHSADEMKIDYITTTIPPKKFFHHRETIIGYKDDAYNVPGDGSEKPNLLFGVHPCDLNAILRLDRLFSEEFTDFYYHKRRQNSAIIALTCQRIGENCFCSSLGTGPSIDHGFDLLVTDLGESFLVEVGSSRGHEMIEGLNLPDASSLDLGEKEKVIQTTLSNFKKEMRIQGLAELASGSDEHDVWTLVAEKGGLAGCFPCLSCGNCSLVCPTCYCYEVADIPDLSLNSGVRLRELDSCQLLEYSEVALNGNFRPDRKSRIRHWMRCKFGAAAGGLESSCVGCGRCIHSCPARIDQTEVAKKLGGR